MKSVLISYHEITQNYTKQDKKCINIYSDFFRSNIFNYLFTNKNAEFSKKYQMTRFKKKKNLINLSLFYLNNCVFPNLLPLYQKKKQQHAFKNNQSKIEIFHFPIKLIQVDNFGYYLSHKLLLSLTSEEIKME